MKPIVLLLSVAAVSLVAAGLTDLAYAEEGESAGGMSDGDKVKLQLYLDFKEFSRNIEEVGVDVSSVAGVARLQSLTAQAEQMHHQNGSK